MDSNDTVGSEWSESLQDLKLRLVAGAIFLGSVVLIGSIGYRLIEPEASWIDSVYMTVITLTTVGFTEVVSLENHPGGRIFTIALILVGMGGVLYFVSTATAFVLEGHIGHVFWRRRMERTAANLSGHLIVCGSGGTAIYTAQELMAVDRSVVVLCDDEGAIPSLRADLGDIPILAGDPTVEDTLVKAGIERAVGIAACSRDDRDNLIVTLIARQLNPGIRIISRVSDYRREERIRNVGADSVVAPHHIGALRIASELIRPTVVTFLDVMLRDGTGGLRVDEVLIPEGSPAVGRTIDQMDIAGLSRALLVALREPDGSWSYNPDPDAVLHADSVLILLGTPDDVARVAEGVGGRMIAAPTAG